MKQLKSGYYFSFLLLLILSFVFGCENTERNDELGIEKVIAEIEDEGIDSPGIKIKIDYLKNRSEEINYSRGIAKYYSFLSKILYRDGNYEEALKHSLLAIKVNRVNGPSKDLGEDYDLLAKTYNRLKNVDSAIISFKKSVEVRKNISDSTGVGAALHNIGFMFWNVSKFDSAIVYFEKALELRKKLNNKEHLASTTNNIGTVYYQWAMYDKALEYYLISLNYNREINNYNNISIILTNIGIVYQETSQNNRAMEYFRESLDYATAANDTSNIAYVYNSIAGAFLESNRDSSIYYYQKSLRAYRAVNSSGGIIICLKGLGENYIRQNQLEEAKNYFNQILNIALSEKNNLRVAEAYNYLGKIYKLQNNLNSAKDYFEKCIEISLEMNTKLFLRDAYKDLSEIYELNNNISGALASLKEHLYYKTQIDNEDSQRKISDLKTKFEFEKYQREIDSQKYENQKQRIILLAIVIVLVGAISAAVFFFVMNNRRKKINLTLQQKNELIEGQSQELEKMNNELTELNHSKEKLFSIIAHDLKNPFSALINYSLILKEDYNEMADSERLEFIGNIQETSVKTYELLENLLNLSASRTGKIDFNPIEIKIKELLEKVTNLYQNQIKEKNIVLSNSIDENQIVYADEKMLEIVIRNLVNNAVKYTNPEGKIELLSKFNDQNILLIIKDNGIGMDEKTKKELFNINSINSTVGTGGEKGTGLGLGLCKEFVEKNNGSIYVESEPNKGSTFYISLPGFSKN
ncbi:MAG: tetratricopeptide repeat-containing sensor histidine kinase [Ignavibacteriaceae bacterium]|nr:tetratricopeptide repeat-containing sensor histidine kinase [Ignavibacteriaceae bacterium]